ncbi:hypothetical protein RSAG8_06099, partial [Rhizoctonia solani AG-8 WAC10335]
MIGSIPALAFKSSNIPLDSPIQLASLSTAPACFQAVIKLFLQFQPYHSTRYTRRRSTYLPCRSRTLLDHLRGVVASRIKWMSSPSSSWMG